MLSPLFWVLEGDRDTREMLTELVRNDALQVVAFERPEEFFAERTGPPDVAIVDAWTVRLCASRILEHLPRERLVVTVTSPALLEVWTRLGAARVHFKPVAIEQLLADVRALADRGEPPISREVTRADAVAHENVVLGRRARF